MTRREPTAGEQVGLPEAFAPGCRLDEAVRVLAAETGVRADEIEAMLATAVGRGAIRETVARLGAEVVVLADVEPERVFWLWPGRIPLGKLALLDGDPGLGKSSIALDVAARLSTGVPMPDGARPDLDGPAGTVLLTAEDGLGDTVRPRLDAAGADPTRIVALRAIRDGEEPGEDSSRLPTVADVAAIEQAVRDHGARLVVLDPLAAFLQSETNSYRDQDVRSALAGLAGLAERTGAAVVLVRHLNKSGGANALYRGGGSIGLIAAARSGLLVAADPDDETGARRVLAATKGNLAAPRPSLAYSLVPAGHSSVRVAWAGASEHTAGSLLAAPADGEERTRLDEAREFLLAELEAGPVESRDLQRRARDAGIAWRTIERASSALGVEKGPREFGGRWEWRLPPPPESANDLGGDWPVEGESPAKSPESASPPYTGEDGGDCESERLL